MLTANKNLPRGQGLSTALVKRAATVELDWDTRQKSRFEVKDSQQRQLGVFLPRGSVVRGGDVLVAEDGSLIRVIAKPQPVLRVETPPGHDALDLLRAAYHLGNRHVALELKPGYLQLERDHVLAEMLHRQLHLAVTDDVAAFEPEGGAYSDHASHEHGAAPTKVIHLTAHAEVPHVHGPGCKHEH